MRIVVLDATPLGLASDPKQTPEAVACRKWLADLRRHNMRVIVPEITDYEVRRELLRANKVRGVRQLNRVLDGVEYLPIHSAGMRLAAELWAQARRSGRPTAAEGDIDADVILAAHVLLLAVPREEYVVATSNPKHLARFVPARRWQEIGVEDEREVGDGNGTA